MPTNNETGLISISAILGLLLLTSSAPPVDASEPVSKGEFMITDFSSDSPNLGWYVQNDNVMGGRSKGNFETTRGELIFAGSTNTNGGGFSSIRTQAIQLDLSTHEGIRLRVKGDGRRYTWQLQTNARWRGRRISYWAHFETTVDEWSTISIPFSSFFPQFHGFMLDGPELDVAQITEMGLYIYDKRDGAFTLRLANIRAY